MRTLTHEEAKIYYNRFGRKQDQQAFYEEPALRAMMANAALDQAQSVVEFGCGTGRLAQELLQHHLPEGAHYLGTDISSTMVALTTGRLTPYAQRASVVLTGGSPTVPVNAGTADRFISTYVFDLLPERDRKPFLAEAGRVLRSGGLLCLAGITDGTTVLSRGVMSGWQWLFARNPRLVGGCRPTSVIAYLAADAWQIRYHQVLVTWGIASEVIIATPRSSSHR
ncbi:MAG TPA: class I SAM-dependent methyltransferase [Caldilineaceae bacterium]|nr:class I SAM-dependent methyltransferase [Caldilineaceae bacterium]